MRVLMMGFLCCVGCATILADESETINFTSHPAGQTVVVDGANYKMPCKVTLGRDTDHAATFPNGETVMIERSFNGLFLVNILLGGLIGMVVDLATGAVNKNLSPNHLEYRDGAVWSGERRLTPVDKPEPAPEP